MAVEENSTTSDCLFRYLLRLVRGAMVVGSLQGKGMARMSMTRYMCARYRLKEGD
jgi:hypothetical protein